MTPDRPTRGQDADTGRNRVETVLGCDDLDAMVEFLRDHLGARTVSVSPADDPHEVVVEATGAMIRLVRGAEGGGRLVVHVPDAGDGRPASERIEAPNGTIVEFRRHVDDIDEVVLPPSVPTLSVVASGDEFGVGRAGMGYRDLLPDRWGGRFIASHIRIAEGGEVGDSVHFHRIRFQMIFCARGWVDLVYEDQGPPFRLQAGDCVLQPPGIRHRVLRSSPGLEVIEVGSPAVHATLFDHELRLPTTAFDPERDFGGQRFVRHVAAGAVRSHWIVDGLRVRDTGVGTATDGLAGAVVVEADGRPGAGSPVLTHDGELCLHVVLAGDIDLAVEDGPARSLGPLDAVALPPGTRWRWRAWTPETEVLQVTLPADAVWAVPPSSD